MTIKRVVLQFAMKIEAEPVLSRLKLHAITSPNSIYPFGFYQGKFGDNLHLTVGLAGSAKRFNVDSIGSIPATLLAETLVTNFVPDLLINPGTAGAFESKGAKIGEVFLGSPVSCFHSRRSSVPAMEEMGHGKYPTAQSEKLAQALKMKTAIVSSGDALDYSREDAEYMKRNGGSIKEMEAGAIGWVCEHHRVPHLPVKAVTDFVDHPADTAEQFKTHYQQAVASLADRMVDILTYLDQNLEDPVWEYSD